MYAETSFYQYDVETMKLINKIGFGQVDGEGLENYDFLGNLDFLKRLRLMVAVMLCRIRLVTSSHDLI